MKISKLQLFIAAVFSLSIFLISFTEVSRVDVIYIAQFIVLFSAYLLIKEKKLLKLAIGNLILADIIYYILVYKLEISTDSPYVVLCTSSLYGLSFGAMVWLLAKENISTMIRLSKKWLELPALLFFTLIAVIYILIPGLKKIVDHGFDFGLLSHAITLLFSLPLVLVCYIFLTNTVKLKNQIVLAGFFILGILDIGIQLETIRYGNLSFSYYDVIWFCAITMTSLFVIEFSTEHQLIEKRSVVNLTKKIFFLVALIPTVIFGFLINSSQSQSPMYFIFLLIATFMFGIVCSSFIQMGIDKFNRDLSSFSLQDSDMDLGRVLEGSPIEFQNSLFEACKNAVEKDMSSIQEERRRLLELSLFYKRMAHDISSPISVLQLLSKFSGNFDDDRRQLIFSATQRVRSIADDILDTNVVEKDMFKKQLSTMTYNELFKLIGEIVMEKNIEFGRQIVDYKLNIRLNNDKEIFAIGSDLARILSNLINNANASDVLESARAIALVVDENDQHLRIKISDNGKGFPQEVLDNNFRTPISQGRHRGHGIGLFSANAAIQKWLGALTLFNENGANVLIELKINHQYRNEYSVELV